MARKLDNWLEAYLVYTSESESPEEFHTWTALSAIAGAVQRKIFFDMGYFLLYPNLYVVLASPPGRCKKSTAMRIGRSLLSQVPGVSFTTDSVTRERLVMDMSQAYKDGHSSMTAYSSELGTLMTSSGMDMVVFLTDIYDSPTEWSHKTKISGTNKIKAPYLNLLAATTPDWIAKAMPLDTIGIGLTSRVIFVYQDTPRIRDPFPSISEEQKKIYDLLSHDLAQMSNISGEYIFSPDAKEMYREWYKDKRPREGDPRLMGYFERKPMHVIKVAMLIAASFSDATLIETRDLQLSLGLLQQAEARMPLVFANVGKNPLSVDYDQVAGAVLANPGITMAGLMRLFKHSVRKEELQEVLDTLLTMGVIKHAEGKYIPGVTL